MIKPIDQTTLSSKGVRYRNIKDTLNLRLSTDPVINLSQYWKMEANNNKLGLRIMNIWFNIINTCKNIEAAFDNLLWK